jgi:hypothetical protein
MSLKPPDPCFRVTYRDLVADKTITVKASVVEDSSLGLGFIRLAGFLFDSGGLVVDPGAEDLKRRLEDVKSLHLSIQCILSIEELGPRNKGLKLKAGRSNLMVMPAPASGLPPGPFAAK